MDSVLVNVLKNAYIRNDNKLGGECMQLFFNLCVKCNLHKMEEHFGPEGYGWLWIYVEESGYIQQAPERKFIRGKQELKKEDLLALLVMIRSKAA